MAKVTTTTPGGVSDAEGRANFFSRIFFCWISPLFSVAKIKADAGEAIEMGDLLELPAMDDATVLSDSFNKSWRKWDAG